MYRIILIIFSLLIMSGFRILVSETWNTKESSPTLWVKVCDDMIDAEIDDNDLSTNDPLYGQNIDVRAVVESIIRDVNRVDKSWIRLALYPADPQNPGTPANGDDTFTLALAENRTIEICESSPTNPFQGGEARPEIEGDEIVGCKIQMNQKARKKARSFTATLTHEIGHCLGLDHPQETRNAIMSYFHSKKQYRLMIDDKMGLIHLYPEDGISLKEKANFGLKCSKD
jgi:hypothetical protein